MKLLQNEESADDDDDEGVDFDKFNEFQTFQYLRAMLSVRNDWPRENGIRITKTKRAAFVLSQFLKSKVYMVVRGDNKTHVNLWMRNLDNNK